MGGRPPGRPGCWRLACCIPGAGATPGADIPGGPNAQNQYDSRSTKSKVKRTHAGRGADARGSAREGPEPWGSAIRCVRCENGISTWSAIVIAQSNLEHCIAFEEGFNES